MTFTGGDLCIYMTCSFEKSKMRMVIQKNNKVVGLVTTHRLGMMDETYKTEKDKKNI